MATLFVIFRKVNAAAESLPSLAGQLTLVLVAVVSFKVLVKSVTKIVTGCVIITKVAIFVV